MVLGLSDTAGDVVATAESSVPTSADEWRSFVADDVTNPMGDIPLATGLSGPIFGFQNLRDTVDDAQDHLENSPFEDAIPDDLPGLDDSDGSDNGGQSPPTGVVVGAFGLLVAAVAIAWGAMS